MPVRQGAIEAGRFADCDHLLLLHQLSARRTRLRKTAIGAAGAGPRRRFSRSDLPQGPGLLRGRLAASRSAQAQAGVSHPARFGDLLQFRNVRRLHKRSLAVGLPETVCRRRAAGGNADHDRGTARRCRVGGRCSELRKIPRRLPVEVDPGLGCDGVRQTRYGAGAPSWIDIPRRPHRLKLSCRPRKPLQPGGVTRWGR